MFCTGRQHDGNSGQKELSSKGFGDNCCELGDKLLSVGNTVTGCWYNLRLLTAVFWKEFYN